MGLVEELAEITQVSQPPCASLLAEQGSAFSHADTVHGAVEDIFALESSVCSVPRTLIAFCSDCIKALCAFLSTVIIQSHSTLSRIFPNSHCINLQASILFFIHMTSSVQRCVHKEYICVHMHLCLQTTKTCITTISNHLI